MPQNLDALYPMVKFDPSMKPKPKRWLIDNLWQAGKVNGVAGFEKSGKSRLVTWLLVGMAKGSVLGLQCTEGMPKILYLAAEETLEDDLQSRLLQYAELQGVPPSQLDLTFMPAMGMRLDLAQQRQWLEQKLIDEDFGMLLIDPLIRVHGASESENSEMTPLLTSLRRWATRFGITVVFLHHTPKIGMDTDMERMANWFRGASDIAAVLDTALYVDRTTKNTINLMRAGRMPPLQPLSILDLGDTRGFTRAGSK